MPYVTDEELNELLKLRKERYYSLVNWKPDYEECGMQFGPSDKEIQEALDKIKKLEPFFEPGR